MLPDRHMVSFVMELLTNRSFTLRTSDGQVSRLRRIHNGVPQGSTLAPTLLNILISDTPKTTSKQCGYADQDIQSLSEYLSRDRDTHRQLDVVVNGAPLPNNNNPVYLGVTLDRSLTYKQHPESLQIGESIYDQKPPIPKKIDTKGILTDSGRIGHVK